MALTEKEIAEKCWRPQDQLTFRSRTLRKLSLPIVRIMLHTKITANQITFIGLLLCIIRLILFSTGNAALMLIGAVILQFNEVWDRVDGAIARLTDSYSMRGSYLDDLYHDFSFITLYAGIGLGLYNNTFNVLYLFYGFIATVFSILTLNVYYHRNIIIYKKCKEPEKQIKKAYFQKGPFLTRIKNLIYLPYLYHAVITVASGITGLYYFQVWYYYIMIYAGYHIIYFLPKAYYGSVFEQDKKRVKSS